MEREREREREKIDDDTQPATPSLYFELIITVSLHGVVL
jgi:hypothetical protein